VLDYNGKISTFEKYLEISNIGLNKFTCKKINMDLNYNSAKNT
jgi:hypothetical protein